MTARADTLTCRSCTEHSTRSTVGQRGADVLTLVRRGPCETRATLFRPPGGLPDNGTILHAEIPCLDRMSFVMRASRAGSDAHSEVSQLTACVLPLRVDDRRSRELRRSIERAGRSCRSSRSRLVPAPVRAPARTRERTSTAGHRTSMRQSNRKTRAPNARSIRMSTLLPRGRAARSRKKRPETRTANP